MVSLPVWRVVTNFLNGCRLWWTGGVWKRAPLRSGVMGAPSYPLAVMFKALLLGQWYGLSDPALEEALGDRLSFRRFCGVPLDQKTPDHSTIWRFREELGRSGVAVAAFGCVT